MEEECTHEGHYSAISSNMIVAGDEVNLIHSVLCGNCGAVFNPVSKVKVNIKRSDNPFKK